MPRDLSANSVYGPRMHPLGDAGRVIAGRYRLEEPIGRGAMGVVWRARDQLLDRDVAVKEVQIAETLTDEEKANAYQRTLREAKTAARLSHPGVVTVYDVAEDGGRPWIVMQLVAAQSLDQVLAVSGPLSPRRTAEMGRQLLSVLSVAHAAGVLHRDVKPSNVLLGRDDRAVLTDFGIATFAGDPRLTQTGMVMGSPGFTAPERIRGEDATPASDLWSLGATLFAAVEGHGPFEGRGGAITTMSAIINEEAPTAADAGALAPVIAALLRRAPSERPDAATAARMITGVLPQLPARTGPASAGYEATALSEASAAPGATALDRSASSDPLRSSGADRAPAGESLATPLAAGTTPASGQPSLSQTSPTTPQPVLGGATAHDQPIMYDPRYEQPTQYDPRSRPAPPPPDFSSWYDPAPRSGPSQPGPGTQPGSGSGPGSRPGSGSRADGSAPPGAWPEYQPDGRRERRRGLWWKIALVALALLGAAAGAATIVLLRHGSSTANGQGTASAHSTATLASPQTAAQIVNAVNMTPQTSLPAGWTTYTHQASNGEVAGFKIAYPASWTPSTNGDRTYLRDPSANINILIDLTPHTFPNDMVAEARYVRARSLPRFPGYVGMGLQAETIRGTPGAWWKFTYDDQGTTQEAIDLLFVLHTPAGAQSYALYMTAPASVWSQTRPIFDEEAETFAPLT
jgi:serine/threonine protein kinase